MQQEITKAYATCTHINKTMAIIQTFVCNADINLLLQDPQCA